MAAARPGMSWSREGRARLAVWIAIAVFLLARAALGQPVPDRSIGNHFDPDWMSRSTLTGDWGGLRTDLANDGVNLTLSYTGEAADNVSGGLRRGSDYAGQTAVGADVDLDRAFGWDGGKLHLMMIDRTGRNLSSDKIGNVFDVQEIYGGEEAVRLVHLALEQDFPRNLGNVVVGRVNESAAFANSPLYCHFLTVALCGVPNAVPLNGGFIVWPFSSWGGRLRLKPSADSYVQFGAYETNPALFNRNGWDWSTNGATGVSLPVELAYRIGQGAGEMPGHYKVGFVHDTSDATDYHHDSSGHPFFSSGTAPAIHSGRNQYYVLADQMVYRPTEKTGLTLLGRFTGAQRDRSLFQSFFFAGLFYQGPFPTREADSIGALVVSGRFSPDLEAFEQQQAAAGRRAIVQTRETVLELHYEAQVTPWFALTPNLQLVFRPAGTRAISDAEVIGLKTSILF